MREEALRNQALELESREKERITKPDQLQISLVLAPTS